VRTSIAYYINISTVTIVDQQLRRVVLTLSHIMTGRLVMR